ncbi:plasmid replication protein RepC [Gellertiella hungarica]|uniref:Replication initiation protein RepC n=1 Tax=Gellertiella hungarica TaxID=1572859 RepID=A0A7W6NMN3_9HYPH|nr:plasmid replication protein RepC [Gellertiella hungarica]MBB4066625.1 replication initiation protein RepC [Gellertiella hungarica]
MQPGLVTTPFGRRPMSLGQIAAQRSLPAVEEGKTIDKWKLYRALCEARQALGITDRALALLNALLSFHPHAVLSAEESLVVFPSNAQLSLRANGMAETTIRRHIALLVEKGLLQRKDSANGKRFARRDREGEVDQAYGFSLMPLLARADEIEAIAAGVVADRLALQRLREEITVCRRDISKLVAAALEEGLPGDWTGFTLAYQQIVSAMPRSLDAMAARDCLDRLETLRAQVLKAMENIALFKKEDGNDRHSGGHIQNSNTDSIHESEQLLEKEQGETPAEERKGMRAPPKVFPLGLVLSACPEILPYGPGGSIGSWRDLMTAAIVVRSMLGVSPSAYEAACHAMGPETAAVVMACILERAGHIQSAGGYLRNLTRKAEAGEFSVGPMLMALLRANGAGQRQRA